MAYYIDLFSPETYTAFSNSARNISGHKESLKKRTDAVKLGDKLLCYMTGLSRWVGVLEVTSDSFSDNTPIFMSENDIYTRRLKVCPLVWLEPEKTIPIHEDICWDHLSITAGKDKGTSSWTGPFRSSLNKISDSDGQYIESLLTAQQHNGTRYELSPSARKKLGVALVEEDEQLTIEAVPHVESTNEHARMQALLARIGEYMHMQIWLPAADRRRVLELWSPSNANTLLNDLPFRYDDRTMRIIENIDVLWVDRHAIVRAFEIEHTTSIYSGILRMADLTALQPNMSIHAHIVAPQSRKDKVLNEISRPAFTLMGNRRPLPEFCSYLSYDAISDLANDPHLRYLRANVLDSYAVYSTSTQ